MLQKFEVKSVHTNVDDNLQKYVTKKLGSLDKYLPRQHRDAAHAMVELKEGKAKDQKNYTCTVILNLPKGNITVSESTLNMYAAVDIVETKLRQQIKKYKDTHVSSKLTQHLTARFRRRTNLTPEQADAEA